MFSAPSDARRRRYNQLNCPGGSKEETPPDVAPPLPQSLPCTVDEFPEEAVPFDPFGPLAQPVNEYAITAICRAIPIAFATKVLNEGLFNHK